MDESYNASSNESLVAQFAAIAKKLNVELTSSVLDSLRNQHNSNENNGDANNTGQNPSTSKNESKIKLELSSDSNDNRSSKGVSNVAFIPKVQVMQEVAQETISAITSRNSQPIDVPSDAAIRSSSNVNSKDSSHSTQPTKKRKRVLTTAELNEKLAALRSENEMLKKQVDIVTNKTAQFDKDRASAEEEMRKMITDNNVSSEELDQVVKNHLEMYADYGSSRHEELTFHLNQLEK